MSVPADKVMGMKPRLRDSSLELYRIICMLLIVSHHYVVNSGALQEVILHGNRINQIFLLILGAWGKVGINCFLLITGYFMCERKISLEKFLKLYLQIAFYGVVLNSIFLISGYATFSWMMVVDSLFPFRGLTWNFLPAFLVLYLLVPYLNTMLAGITQRMHLLLIMLLLGLYSVLPHSRFFALSFNYVEWFAIVYLVGAYLRKHPNRFTSNCRLMGSLSVMLIALAVMSVFVMLTLAPVGLSDSAWYYYWMSDSNKLLALFIAVTTFLFFLNLHLAYTHFINLIASSVFGVLLIHANSDYMRRWLWIDVMDNVHWVASKWCWAHALVAIVLVFGVCSCIDIVRKCFVERYLIRGCNSVLSRVLVSCGLVKKDFAL